MICSSEFSLDENSVWDPKAIRQLLIISEDQLNILNNIPEWTKEKDSNYYSRINDSCINTQVELNPSNTLLRDQEVINSNIEFFDKNFDTRENIIQTYKLNALKFSKSISLFEINKISTVSSCVNTLSPALSLPNLSLFSKNFSAQFENKSYLCERSDLSTQLNFGILNIEKSKTCIENPDMEVVSQLPAVVPQIVKNNENFAVVDNTILSASQTIQSSDNSSNSCDLSTFVDVNKSDNLISVATKKTNLVEIDKLDSGDENVASNENKQIIVNNNILDLQENTTKLAETTDLNLHEKMETDSCIVRESTVNNKCIHDTSEKIKLSELEDLNVNEKNELQVIMEENVINNDSSLNKDKNSNISVEGKILDEVNETSVEISKQPSVDPKLYESKVTVVSSDELKIKITDSSYDSRMNAEIVLKTACQGAGDGKAVPTKNLPFKRKLEPKARSSKRSKGSRDKQGCPDERSIKKADEIYYSAEDTKIMFDLLKLFL